MCKARIVANPTTQKGMDLVSEIHGHEVDIVSQDLNDNVGKEYVVGFMTSL